jgi:hypothetical protein
MQEIEPLQEVTMETESIESKPKSSPSRWVGLAVLIIVLVGAAFVGGQLLNQQINPLESGGGAIGGNEFQPRQISVIPAEELPESPPDRSGTYVRRQDNSLFISLGEDSGVSTSGGSSEYSGAMVEIVLNAETILYQEVLDLNSRPATSGEIQQQVTEGSVEAIGDTSYIWVWGRESGDRILAEVLVYSVPMIKPASGS